jgi:hypothetical protein
VVVVAMNRTQSDMYQRDWHVAYCKFHERVYGLLYYFAYEYKKKEMDVLSSAIVGYYLLS